MSILLQLFFMFAKLSVFAFGGGYVMFPMLISEVEKNGLLSTTEISDILAIAGMSPGAVAVNAAVGTGFKLDGLQGAIASFLGIAVPCAIIVIVVATFFFKVYDHHLVKSALYGLRPVITGIILYAAYKIASANGIIASAPDDLFKEGWNLSISGVHLFEIKSLIIAAISFLLLTKTKVHPVILIVSSGIVGIFVF